MLVRTSMIFELCPRRLGMLILSLITITRTEFARTELIILVILNHQITLKHIIINNNQ